VIYIIVAMNFQQQRRDFLVLVVGALFALPFIFFSLAGGYFADRYSKRSVTIRHEIHGDRCDAVCHRRPRDAEPAARVRRRFLISTQAALFGPSKYGLLPELLPEKRAIVGQWNH